MLLVGVGTLVGTIGLYIVVPKGFLPQQDTGVLVAVTEAAQSVSIPRLVALQTQVAEIVERDPAVTGVVSFVGAGTINATPNTGRLTIALKPISQRDPVAGGDRAHAAGDRRHSPASRRSSSRCRTSRSAPASAARSSSTR